MSFQKAHLPENIFTICYFSERKVSITENRVFFQCFKFLILKYVVTLLLEEVLVIPEHFLDYRWLSLSEVFMSLDSTNHSSNSNMKVMNNKLHKHCSSITLCGLE